MAQYGTILIANIPYDVSTRVSNSVITLTEANNPGADVAALTTYQLYQDTYTLPAGFQNCNEMINFSNMTHTQYVDPAGWLELHRILRVPGTPRSWTVQPSPKFQGVLCAKFFPPPDQAYRYDFVFRKRPRNLVISLYNSGTATCTSASTTVTGTGTWTSAMVGSVIRFSSSTRDAVTGLSGENPYILERVITAFTSATNITIDAVPGMDLTGVKYSISDPVDIEAGAMLTYLQRECEKQMRAIKRMPSTPAEEMMYQQAMVQAWGADDRARERKASGDYPWTGYNLRDVQIGSNIGG